ncbi:hypothetical protein EC991_010428 [Linnemannia zychae]|nr:hypothetical protein EC991_010428 [Linnemannia zychae]
METNHYDTLGLKFSSFSQKQLKTNFRKASLQYHPDKVGEAGAEIFVRIRAAHEVLVDPTLRLAYDRFGPSILSCTRCKTNKDYFNEGFKSVGPLLFPSKAQSKEETIAELMKRLQTLSDIAALETMVQVKSWMDTLVGQDECITQLRRELGYMSLEMRLGQDSGFFDTRAAIKARIERQGDMGSTTAVDRKERLCDLD